jgi:hypothetical protein
MSRFLTAALFTAGCLTAAAGGSYLAIRQNAVPAPVAAPAPEPEQAPASAIPPPAVQETEGVIDPPKTEPTPALEPESTPVPPAPEIRRRPTPATRPASLPPVMRASEGAALPAEPHAPDLTGVPSPAPVSAGVDQDDVESAAPAREIRRDRPPSDPVIQEVVIPASAVIGLEIETTISTERAQIEDRVDARVTRDVFADGRLALPAGSRVIGGVTLVNRGGKVKERARLGVRFHTIVLANGRHVRLRTEPIYRDGDSPAGESSRKIGGAAIGGAVLGAILGGGKGAIAGATAGAAGGTAAVMSGDRHPAVLASGSILTVKLASPLSFDIER